MSQTILIPTDAVVCIIGQTCTGKSTLSTKLLKRVAPQPAVLISGDIVFEEKFGIAPDLLVSDVAKIQQLGGLDVVNDEYGKVLKQKIVEGLDQPGLLIYEFAPNNVQEVLSFIIVTTVMRETAPFVLIKMDLDKCLARKFRKVRRKQGRCLPEYAIKATETIHKPIVKYRYSDLYPWITEYVITDPRNVELELAESTTK